MMWEKHSRKSMLLALSSDAMGQNESKWQSRTEYSRQGNSIFILGWCILLRLYINEKIKSPLFANKGGLIFSLTLTTIILLHCIYIKLCAVLYWSQLSK
jgi:hypothetical protein